MSISKEERERIEDRLGNRWLFDGDYKRPESTRVDAAQMDVYTLLKALDAADEQIADLQRENERLNYMLRYIDATSVDRRLTMKANEAWLKKEERGL